jgi:FkbM family methyltransferase
MFDRLAFWKQKGLSPHVIYDIGAHNGSWYREAKKIFPTSHIICFEANQEHHAALEDLSGNIVLLGAENKSQVGFFRNTIGCTTGNSIYLEQTYYFTPQTAVVDLLPMRRLDSFVEEKNIPAPDFMKLDVQGAELDILKGAGSLLLAVKYCVLEVSLHGYNREAPLIEEVIAFMKSQNFVVLDFIDFHRINGYLAQVDILFAHSSTGLRKNHFYDGVLEFS